METDMSNHTLTFEGSDAAATFIDRVQHFLRDELGPLAAEHQISHERGAERRCCSAYGSCRTSAASTA